jgi:hypothetical protein
MDIEGTIDTIEPDTNKSFTNSNSNIDKLLGNLTANVNTMSSNTELNEILPYESDEVCDPENIKDIELCGLQELSNSLNEYYISLQNVIQFYSENISEYTSLHLHLENLQKLCDIEIQAFPVKPSESDVSVPVPDDTGMSVYGASIANETTTTNRSTKTIFGFIEPITNFKDCFINLSEEDLDSKNESTFGTPGSPFNNSMPKSITISRTPRGSDSQLTNSQTEYKDILDARYNISPMHPDDNTLPIHPYDNTSHIQINKDTNNILDEDDLKTLYVEKKAYDTCPQVMNAFFTTILLGSVVVNLLYISDYLEKQKKLQIKPQLNYTNNLSLTPFQLQLQMVGGGKNDAYCNGQFINKSNDQLYVLYLDLLRAKSFAEKSHDFKGVTSFPSDTNDYLTAIYAKILDKKHSDLENSYKNVSDLFDAISSDTSERNYYIQILNFIDNDCERISDLTVVKYAKIEEYELDEKIHYLTETGEMDKIVRIYNAKKNIFESYFMLTMDNKPVQPIFDMADFRYQFADNGIATRMLTPLVKVNVDSVFVDNEKYDDDDDEPGSNSSKKISIYGKRLSNSSSSSSKENAEEREAKDKALRTVTAIKSSMFNIYYAAGMIDPKNTNPCNMSNFYPNCEGILSQEYKDYVLFQISQDINLSFVGAGARSKFIEALYSLFYYFGVIEHFKITNVSFFPLLDKNEKEKYDELMTELNTITTFDNAKNILSTRKSFISRISYQGIRIDYTINDANKKTINISVGYNNIANIHDYITKGVIFKNKTISMPMGSLDDTVNKLYELFNKRINDLVKDSSAPKKSIFARAASKIKSLLNMKTKMFNETQIKNYIALLLKSYGDSLQVNYVTRYHLSPETAHIKPFITTSDKNVIAESLLYNTRVLNVGTGIVAHDKWTQSFSNFFTRSDKVIKSTSDTITTNIPVTTIDTYHNSILSSCEKIKQYVISMNNIKIKQGITMDITELETFSATVKTNNYGMFINIIKNILGIKSSLLSFNPFTGEIMEADPVMAAALDTGTVYDTVDSLNIENSYDKTGYRPDDENSLDESTRITTESRIEINDGEKLQNTKQIDAFLKQLENVCKQCTKDGSIMNLIIEITNLEKEIIDKKVAISKKITNTLKNTLITSINKTETSFINVFSGISSFANKYTNTDSILIQIADSLCKDYQLLLSEFNDSLFEIRGAIEKEPEQDAMDTGSMQISLGKRSSDDTESDSEIEASYPIKTTEKKDSENDKAPATPEETTPEETTTTLLKRTQIATSNFKTDLFDSEKKVQTSRSPIIVNRRKSSRIQAKEPIIFKENTDTINRNDLKQFAINTFKKTFQFFEAKYNKAISIMEDTNFINICNSLGLSSPLSGGRSSIHTRKYRTLSREKRGTVRASKESFRSSLKKRALKKASKTQRHH